MSTSSRIEPALCTLGMATSSLENSCGKYWFPKEDRTLGGLSDAIIFILHAPSFWELMFKDFISICSIMFNKYHLD